MTTIVIGTDGSTQADGALRFGGALARALGARVVVATAYVHTPPLRGESSAYEGAVHDATLEIARAGAAKLAGVVEAKPCVASGTSIADALHCVAEAQSADLLVVATSARRRIAGHQLGSVAEAVAHHSPCSVAVVPPIDSDPCFERIGVAVDGTPAAHVALEFASGLADHAGGESPKLTLVHVKPQFARVPQPGLTPPDPRRTLEPEQLEAMAVEAAAHGQAQVVEPLGDAAAELVRISEALDVLVIGSRDHGAVKRLLLGSVSTDVVRHATRPVIVVPPLTGITSGWAPDPARTAGA